MSAPPASPTVAELGVNVVFQDRSVPLFLRASATVADLRRAVHASAELGALTRGKRVRLIAAGRLLGDDVATLASLGLADGAHVHLAVSDLGGGSGGTPTQSQQQQSQTQALQQDLEPVPTAGFDRLRLVGLAGDEVTVLRSMFFPEVRPLLSSLPGLPNETEAARILRAEEIWMRSQTDDSEFALNLRPLLVARPSLWAQAPGLRGGFSGLYGGPGGLSRNEDLALHVNDAAAGGGAAGDGAAADEGATASDGTMASFFMGFLAGWTLGIFMLIFACSPSSSRRFKLGVLSGIACSSVVQLIRLSNRDAAAETADAAGSGGTAGSGGGGGQGADSGAWSGANKVADYFSR